MLYQSDMLNNSVSAVFLSTQTFTFYNISADSQLLSCPVVIQYSLCASSKLIMYALSEATTLVAFIHELI